MVESKRKILRHYFCLVNSRSISNVYATLNVWVYQGERKYLIILFTEENMWNDRVMKSSCTHPFTYVFNTYLFLNNFFLKSTQLATVKILKYGCLSFPRGVDKPWKRLTMDNCDVFFFLKGKQNTEGALDGRVFWSRKRKLVRERSVSRWSKVSWSLLIYVKLFGLYFAGNGQNF